MRTTISVEHSIGRIERLIPAWVGRLLGWKTCARCGHVERSVIFDRTEDRNLCSRCWAKFVYFPRFVAEAEGQRQEGEDA